MKKYFFIIACLLSTPIVADVALYDPEIRTLEISELIIIGQEGMYYVEMQLTEKEGLNFKVILAEKVLGGVEDSNASRTTTYDPITGIVEIPSVAVFSEDENKPLKTFSAVKMLKDEGDGYFFTVIGNPK